MKNLVSLLIAIIIVGIVWGVVIYTLPENVRMRFDAQDACKISMDSVQSSIEIAVLDIKNAADSGYTSATINVSAGDHDEVVDHLTKRGFTVVRRFDHVPELLVVSWNCDE